LSCLAAGRAQAADDSGEATFLQRNLCPIQQILNAVHDRPWAHADEQNRFLILQPRGRLGAYAQCVFFESGRSVHCEVASPFFAMRNPRPDIARKAAVARLGYSLDDSKDNYIREFRLDAKDAPPLAEFMLRSLYESFLDDPQTQVMFNAPMVKSVPSPGGCTPTS
jgi:hypothetical protein